MKFIFNWCIKFHIIILLLKKLFNEKKTYFWVAFQVFTLKILQLYNMSQREQVKSIIIAKTSEIVDQSTFHGVTKIFNTKSKPIKFIWSSYFIVSFCLCAYFVINTLTNYFQWSVITNIDNIYERYSRDFMFF